jgi:peptidoglycan/xylan/chitin deacetylase (PgdA/CDA1 family)
MPKHIKRKTKKLSKSNFNFKNYLYLLFVLLVVFMVGLFIDKFISSQIKTIVETSRSEVRKIPTSIEKQYQKEASISATFRVPILLYHYVEYVQDKKDTIRQGLNINPFIFDNQIKTLSEACFTFITAKELGEVLDGKRVLPKKPVLLTFDDGHWDLDTEVLPILKKYHAKATAYIISGFLGGSDFLSQTQLKDVISSRLVEVGAHTVHHISLKGKFSPIVNYEISQSKKDLEKDYNLHVVSFAYPGGAFDEQAIEAVKNAGFSTAVSTIPGFAQSIANRFFLFRLRPGYRTGQQLLDYINQ